LLLGNDHTGASELAELAWRAEGLPLPELAAVLKALITAALQLAARQRVRAGPRVIIELPGVRDAAGQSPFWQGLGRHFYSGDPIDAEARHGADWPSHVAALLPRHPVLAAFLPEAAQAAIAQVAPRALLLRELLHACGLRYSHHIGIHDGGPVLEADLDDFDDRHGSDMHLRKSDAAG
jgi:arginine N-succinyltransferase